MSFQSSCLDMEKFQSLRSFVSVASEYTKHPTEATTSVIQRNLGAISASLDLSIFDPGTNVAALFYVALHELMSNSGSRSNLMWSAVDVLQTACRNTAARHALIHTFKFAPILTKLLEANLTSEKKVRALKLLQELTYGIKISWQEAHLPYLISTLSQWVTQSNEEEIITLSLGVLVNLCYKNLPAVYVLMKTVNTKTFLQSVVRTRQHNTSIRVQCCKLLIILEQTNTDILDSNIIDVVDVTFSNIIPSLKKEDILLLRHIVDFFDDIRQNERFKAVILNYPKYSSGVEDVLRTLKDVSHRECARLVMEFLSSLMKLRVTDLISLYPLIVKNAVSWVPIEYVGSKALALIKTIVIDSKRTKNNSEVLEELDLSVLTLLIKEDDDMDGSFQKNSIETDKNLTELMKLFHELIKAPAMRTRVLEVFSVSKMRLLMRAILDCSNDSALLEKSRNHLNDPSTDFYVHALALVADLAANNTHWLTLYTELLQRKQLQMILATALFTGDIDVKQKVLQLTSTVGFPQECISAVARGMASLEPLLLVQERTNFTKAPEETMLAHGFDCLPFFSKPQEDRLDSFLLKLQSAHEKNELSDISTSGIMELYEYKMAAMSHAERTMQASLEAATNHSTKLQHRLAQMTAQSSQLHQVLFNNQQCLEGMQNEKFALTKKLQETEEKTKKTHSVQIQEISGLKKIVMEKESQINIYSARIKELQSQNEEISILKEKLEKSHSKSVELANELQEMRKLLHKLQESNNRKDQTIEEKNREITSYQKDLMALNQEIKQQAQLCHEYQKTIAVKEDAVQKLQNELHSLSRMRDMIFELTAKKDMHSDI